ncbi:MAG TPA: 2-dehydropantoate 2-reductase [Candidatus Sulfotelmatobacter sp.]|jgi:2-dehydropantoate 2-reductase|nr:2-dehydropantoate 2-reductase [Candidatus Sulfotelmatobacter sp.]
MADKYIVGIIGGGSVGLTFAALLADVSKIIVKTRSNQQSTQIQQGVKLTERTKTGEEITRVIHGIDSTDDFADLSSCDAVIVTVKSYDTEIIAKELSHVLKENAEVLTLQNGLQAYSLLKENIKNPDRVFAGVTMIGSTRLDLRSVSVGYNLRTDVDSKAVILGKVLDASKFEYEASDDITQAVWEKMALNTPQNALGALTNLSFGEMKDSNECIKIADKLLKEFEFVAKAEGIHFTGSLMDKLLDNWNMSKHHPSMWQDLQNRKRTEIDAINGAISALGKKHRIATPYNDMITSLIKVIELA